MHRDRFRFNSDDEIRRLERLVTQTGDPVATRRLAVLEERRDGLAGQLDRVVTGVLDYIDAVLGVDTDDVGVIRPAHVRRLVSAFDEDCDLLWRTTFGAPNVHMVNEEEEVVWGVGLRDPKPDEDEIWLPYVVVFLHYRDQWPAPRQPEASVTRTPYVTIGIRGGAPRWVLEEQRERQRQWFRPYPTFAWPGFVNETGRTREEEFGPRWPADFVCDADSGPIVEIDSQRSKIRVPLWLAQRWVTLGQAGVLGDSDMLLQQDVEQLLVDPSRRRRWALLRNQYNLLDWVRPAGGDFRYGVLHELRRGVGLPAEGPIGDPEISRQQWVVAEHFLEDVIELNPYWGSLNVLYEVASEDHPHRRQPHPDEFGVMLVRHAAGVPLPPEVQVRLRRELRMPPVPSIPV